MEYLYFPLDSDNGGQLEEPIGTIIMEWINNDNGGELIVTIIIIMEEINNDNDNGGEQ